MEPASLDTDQNQKLASPETAETEASQEAKKQPRTGSLENPEVLENVPGHVIPILEREFDDFDTESTRYLKGDLREDDFIKFRLKQGVYGQRQPDVQMVRVKLPMGGVTPEQLDAFADVIEKYVPLKKGHITTRQNIQMHHVPLPDAAKLIRELGDTGLSSREGCGNTMRNVTGDPRAGVLPGEQVEEELEQDWVQTRDFSLDGILLEHDEEANAPAVRETYASPNGDYRPFDHFVATNVDPQRQPGFSTVEVKVTRGDLSPEQLRGLAEIMREYTGGYARTTVHQNLVLRWVRDEALYEVWQRLSELELGEAGADEITDVVSCPGTDSCKLGITSSMGLNQAIHERVLQMQLTDERTRTA